MASISPPKKVRPSCPLYGFVPDGNFLMDIDQNNCGLKTPMLLPCRMEKSGQKPDFSTCQSNHFGQETWKGLLWDYVVFPRELQPENGGLTGLPFSMWADMVSTGPKW